MTTSLDSNVLLDILTGDERFQEFSPSLTVLDPSLRNQR
jgi:hypothetical protein